MDGPHLIYFSDPMCSWCYGFQPTVEAIRRAFGRGLPIRLVMGGLRPGTTTPLTPEARTEIAGHWAHVQEASSLPFDAAVLCEGFVYDTGPAARAVVVARRQGEEAALAYLMRVQRAFYAESLDVTAIAVLADLAQDQGLDRQAFLDDWNAETTKQETWADYAISQRAGVTGFPTLVAGPGASGEFGVVTRGWAAPDDVVRVLKDWVGRISV